LFTVNKKWRHVSNEGKFEYKPKQNLKVKPKLTTKAREDVFVTVFKLPINNQKQN